jgi:hypothetical protein
MNYILEDVAGADTACLEIADVRSKPFAEVGRHKT